MDLVYEADEIMTKDVCEPELLISELELLKMTQSLNYREQFFYENAFLEDSDKSQFKADESIESNDKAQNNLNQDSTVLVNTEKNISNQESIKNLGNSQQNKLVDKTSLITNEKSKEVIKNWITSQSMPVNKSSNLNSQLSLQELPRKKERNDDYFQGTKGKSVKSGNISNEKQNESISFKDMQQKSKSDIDKKEEHLYKDLQQNIQQSNLKSNKTLFKDGNLKIVDDDETMDRKKNASSDPPGNNSRVHNTDNKINTAKNFDKFGNVDGYSEKDLLIGQGTQRNEQEFLRSQKDKKISHDQSEFLRPGEVGNKIELQEKRDHESNKNAIHRPVHVKNETRAEVFAPYKEGHQRFIHGRGGKDNVCFEKQPRFQNYSQRNQKGEKNYSRKHYYDADKKFYHSNDNQNSHIKTKQGEIMINKSFNRNNNINSNFFDKTNNNYNNDNQPMSKKHELAMKNQNFEKKNENCHSSSNSVKANLKSNVNVKSDYNGENTNTENWDNDDNNELQNQSHLVNSKKNQTQLPFNDNKSDLNIDQNSQLNTLWQENNKQKSADDERKLMNVQDHSDNKSKISDVYKQAVNLKPADDGTQKNFNEARPNVDNFQKKNLDLEQKNFNQINLIMPNEPTVESANFQTLPAESRELTLEKEDTNITSLGNKLESSTHTDHYENLNDESDLSGVTSDAAMKDHQSVCAPAFGWSQLQNTVQMFDKHPTLNVKSPYDLQNFSSQASKIHCNDEERQIFITNQISNNSSRIYLQHQKVADLSKRLSEAQAELFALQIESKTLHEQYGSHIYPLCGHNVIPANFSLPSFANSYENNVHKNMSALATGTVVKDNNSTTIENCSNFHTDKDFKTDPTSYMSANIFQYQPMQAVYFNQQKSSGFQNHQTNNLQQKYREISSSVKPQQNSNISQQKPHFLQHTANFHPRNTCNSSEQYQASDFRSQSLIKNKQSQISNMQQPQFHYHYRQPHNQHHDVSSLITREMMQQKSEHSEKIPLQGTGQSLISYK